MRLILGTSPHLQDFRRTSGRLTCMLLARESANGSRETQYVLLGHAPPLDGFSDLVVHRLRHRLYKYGRIRLIIMFSCTEHALPIAPRFLSSLPSHRGHLSSKHL
jgi:hypothetical protein